MSEKDKYHLTLLAHGIKKLIQVNLYIIQRIHEHRKQTNGFQGVTVRGRMDRLGIKI